MRILNLWRREQGGADSGASRRRFSYANVAATLALVLALGAGGAWAAGGYLITSTSQIKPSVVKKLHGARGRAGKPGATGAIGATGGTGATGASGTTGLQGATGPTGATGPFPPTLPSGVTLRGVFLSEGTATGAAGNIGDNISFGWTLSAAPVGHFIQPGGTVPSGCSGTPTSPGAAPGNLCVFDVEDSNVATVSSEVWSPPANMGGVTEPYGAGVFTLSAAAGTYEFGGSWAVTAP